MASDVHKRAAKDLAIKLKQETKLKKVLAPHFKSLAKDFHATYLHNSAFPNLTKHKEFLNKTLKNHYENTATKFSTHIRDKIGTPKNNDAIQPRIVSRIDREATVQATNAADDIADTTQKNMNDAVKKAAAVAIAAGVIATKENTANLAYENLKDYFDNRVDMISVTETAVSAEDGKNIEYEEMYNGDASYEDRVGDTDVYFSDMEKVKTWVAVMDDHTREAHAEADGQEVDEDQPFEVDDEELMYPTDDSLGASAGNTVNCLHPDTVVYDTIPLNLSRRSFNGEMVTIHTSGGNKLSVTPNHPVLTLRGWVGAKFLQKGDGVISRSNGKRMGFSNFNIEDVDPRIEKIFNSFFDSGIVVRMSAIGMNFHGERVVDGDVDIINSARFLFNAIEPETRHPIEKIVFPHADILPSFFSSDGTLESSRNRLSEFSQRLVCFFNEAFSIFVRGVCHSEEHGFGSVSGIYSCLIQSIQNRGSAALKVFCDSLDGKVFIEQFCNFLYCYRIVKVPGMPVGILRNFLDGFFIDRIDHIETTPYNGYVYNIHDLSGYYNGNGIILHNCRCSAVYDVKV